MIVIFTKNDLRPQYQDLPLDELKYTHFYFHGHLTNELIKKADYVLYKGTEDYKVLKNRGPIGGTLYRKTDMTLTIGDVSAEITVPEDIELDLINEIIELL